MQYFLEKLLEILFWSKLTLGSEVSNARLIVGLSKLNVKINKAKKNLNNRYRSITISSIVFFLLLFQMKLEILKAKINFNLLIIYSIAISSAIIVEYLLSYSNVRIVDDIIIFP